MEVQSATSSLEPEIRNYGPSVGAGREDVLVLSVVEPQL